jgi:hypothetical protein
MSKNQAANTSSLPVAPTRVVRFIDRQGERLADLVWHGLKRTPYLGVTLAAGLAFGVASVVGVAELAMAVGAGYAAFKMLRMDVPPSQAVREAVAIEKDIAA